ncbi:MAG TPA: PAS domain S-box protein [bacterium]
MSREASGPQDNTAPGHESAPHPLLALEERAERFRTLVEASSDWIWEVDENGVYTYVSPKVRDVLGYEPGEVLGRTPFDFMPPEERERVATEFLGHVRHGEPITALENVNLRKDGGRVTLETSGVPVRDAEGRLRGYRGIDRDISARKRAEQALRESEERYRKLYERTPVMMHSIDAEGRLLSISGAWLAQLGYTREEVIGRRSTDFLTERSRRYAREVVLPAFMKSGVCRDVEYQFVRKDGSVMDTLLSAIAEHDASGAFVRSLAVVVDVTEKRALEQERLRAQKLESIGTLAGGIAHDFNNLLQGVFGYISMARLKTDRPDEVLAMLSEAEQALHQAVGLTSQLLTYAKGGGPLKKIIALQPVIENAVRLALSGSRARPELAIPGDLWAVDADAGQIGQVVQNIVLNAEQSMPSGGTVTVTARNVPAAGGPAAHAGASPGNVEIVIRDEGTGIAAEHLPRVFDPYFTTKEKGTGLGLATVYSIVRNHGGTVDLASEPGRGTTVTVLLPAAPAQPDVEPAPAPRARRPLAEPRRARILVMDDEPVVREVAGALLGAIGHEPTLAENGEAALERYREAAAAGRPFDAVILDLTVRGGMGGKETMRRLLELDPAVKAIVSSGYSADGVLADYRDHGFRDVLAKPYTLTGLRDVLDRLLA